MRVRETDAFAVFYLKKSMCHTQYQLVTMILTMIVLYGVSINILSMINAIVHINAQEY